MKAFILALFSFSFTFLPAQSSTWNWAAQAGGTHDDRSFATYTDSTGYTYITGYFSTAAAFGSFTLTGNSSGTLFLAKYSPGGNCVWAIKDTGSSGGYSLDADNSGNCYVMGDVSLSKYNSAGNLLWRQSTPPGFTIDLDHSGHCFVIVQVFTTYIFGADTIAGPCTALLEFDANGNRLRGKAIDANANLNVLECRVDATGSVYIAGYLVGPDTIDGTPLNTAASAGSNFILVKLNPSWALSWVKKGTGLGYGTCTGICLGPQGEVYVTATSNADNEIVGGDTIFIDQQSGMASALLKFDSTGRQHWMMQDICTQAGSVIFADVIADSTRLYLGGHAASDFSLGNLNFINPAGRNGFVIALDTSGQSQFAVKTGGQNPAVFTRNIGLDGAKNVYLSGWYFNPVDFPPYAVGYYGVEDVFIAKTRLDSISGITVFQTENSTSLFSMNEETWLLQTGQENAESELLFVVYDINGRMLLQTAVNNAKSVIHHPVFASGIYCWQLWKNDQCIGRGKILN